MKFKRGRNESIYEATQRDPRLWKKTRVIWILSLPFRWKHYGIFFMKYSR